MTIESPDGERFRATPTMRVPLPTLDATTHSDAAAVVS
jgi:hypothetical protein